MATRAPVGASNKSELFDLKIFVEIFPRPDDALHWKWNLIGGFPTTQEVLKIAESLKSFKQDNI